MATHVCKNCERIFEADHDPVSVTLADKTVLGPYCSMVCAEKRLTRHIDMMIDARKELQFRMTYARQK